jgi:hypothetical protein
MYYSGRLSRVVIDKQMGCIVSLYYYYGYLATTSATDDLFRQLLGNNWEITYLSNLLYNYCVELLNLERHCMYV